MKDAHELYMSGHVEIRTSDKQGKETLRADEVYYDVQRGVAVARKADLELKVPQAPVPIHVETDLLIRESDELYRMNKARVFATILPSDPGLLVEISDAEIIQRKKEKKRLFGLITARDKEGQPIVETQSIFTGYNTIFKLEGWPIFYFPYLRGRVDDPLGPLENLNFSFNRIFGFQIYTSWDLMEILGLDPVPGYRWRLDADWLTSRGPALGSEFDFASDHFFGWKAKTTGMIKGYNVWDHGNDILGFDRGNFVAYPSPATLLPVVHPDYRGWGFGQLNVQELPAGFSIVGQFSFLSDRNFLEEFFLNSHLNDLDQMTYLNVKQQQENWAWTLLAQVNTRDWMTETNWLPKADGYLLGQTFSFGQLEDLLVYNGHASAGYAQLRPTVQAPFAYLPTDVRADTGRFDLWQDVSIPFYLGPVKVAPYIATDAALYTQNVNGDTQGRLYGGGGIRWSLPLSKLYPDIHSDLFNLNSIYHKMTFTGNYYAAQSNASLNNFPQLTRFNDDVSDQALRDIRPWQQTINPGAAAFLTTSNLFNPQYYALRRLVDTNPEAIDTIEVVQLGLRQRWQTKRGMFGNEHVVDWMTFNVDASIFPHSNRDNFGHLFGIVQYDWVWNVGDRTALTSSGWLEPFSGGPRAFDIGAFVNRPDSTNFYVGYRQIDPLESKAVIAAITYPFSGKYAMTASTVWDFGVNVTTYSLMLSRMGSDILMGLGFSYNSTLNTFGLTFEITPNLARRPGGMTGSLFPSKQMNDVSSVRN
jgi:hypothetical protein